MTYARLNKARKRKATKKLADGDWLVRDARRILRKHLQDLKGARLDRPGGRALVHDAVRGAILEWSQKHAARMAPPPKDYREPDRAEPFRYARTVAFSLVAPLTNAPDVFTCCLPVTKGPLYDYQNTNRSRGKERRLH